MWDPAALVPGGDGLNAYTPFVQELADLSVHFARPVLLINGDSHLFEADHPLADPASPAGQIHGTQAVPNLTRITVQGSTNKPREWLRLTIDPRSPQIFSWQNAIPICRSPHESQAMLHRGRSRPRLARLGSLRRRRRSRAAQRRSAMDQARRRHLHGEPQLRQPVRD